MFELKTIKENTTIKCIRFPNELIEKIDEIRLTKNVNFSLFVLEACKYAIANMKDDKKSLKK